MRTAHLQFDQVRAVHLRREKHGAVSARALAYAFWLLSGLPVLLGLWGRLRSGLRKFEETRAAELQP